MFSTYLKIEISVISIIIIIISIKGYLSHTTNVNYLDSSIGKIEFRSRKKYTAVYNEKHNIDDVYISISVKIFTEKSIFNTEFMVDDLCVTIEAHAPVCTVECKNIVIENPGQYKADLIIDKLRPSI